jgi:TusA-related sulfurtransferase
MEPTRILDARGLVCPVPIMKISKEAKTMSHGEILKVSASDPAFEPDLRAWSKQTGHEIVSLEKEGETVTAVIRII